MKKNSHLNSRTTVPIKRDNMTEQRGFLLKIIICITLFLCKVSKRLFIVMSLRAFLSFPGKVCFREEENLSLLLYPPQNVNYFFLAMAIYLDMHL